MRLAEEQTTGTRITDLLTNLLTHRQITDGREGGQADMLTKCGWMESWTDSYMAYLHTGRVRRQPF